MLQLPELNASSPLSSPEPTSPSDSPRIIERRDASRTESFDKGRQLRNSSQDKGRQSRNASNASVASIEGQGSRSNSVTTNRSRTGSTDVPNSPSSFHSPQAQRHRGSTDQGAKHRGSTDQGSKHRSSTDQGSKHRSSMDQSPREPYPPPKSSSSPSNMAPSPGRSTLGEVSSARLRALKGLVLAERQDGYNWLSPSSKLAVFISSTFTDTDRERNVLMEKILPDLRKQGRAAGIEVVFVDMRWGVRDENTIDHLTWITCKQELERCYQESAGMFFLSLQCDKYGYRPLPREMGIGVMDAALAKAEKEEKIREIDLAREWYIRDENCELYVLKKLASLEDPVYWNEVHPVLRDGILQGLVFGKDGGEGSGIQIGQSVSEWEARFALSKPGAADRSCWLHRHFEGGVTLEQDPKQELTDRSDRLNGLKETMRNVLGNRVIEDSIGVESYLEFQPKWFNYIDSFETKARKLFQDEIAQILEEKKQWIANGCGVNMSGEELAEVLHHVHWACEKIKDFEGREKLLEESMSIIRRGTVTTEQQLSGVCLAIVGKSGAGKTAFMSMLAKMLIENKPDRPVLVRFCGTSRGSMSGVALVTSLCRQIERIFSLPRFESCEYLEWVKYFHTLLEDNAVAIVIDSLDQLSNNDDERNGLSFLRNLSPNDDTRVIVSCLPDEWDELTQKRYFYGCDTRLRDSSVRRIHIQPLKDRNALNMIEQLLGRDDRYLMQAQLDMLGTKLKNATALYCRLAVRVAATWSSTTAPIDCILPSNVPELINFILDKIENDYGAAWSRVALACLTFSKAGLSDAEMQDILTMEDSRVLKTVFQYSTPTVRRFPLHVWLRLKGALSGLLVEREHGCVQWYHRQLKETAEARYSGEEGEKQLAHELMALYFGDLCGTDGEERLVAKQPLTFNGDLVFRREAQINVRRCIEAPFHLVAAGKKLQEAACRTLCNVELVSACVKVGHGFELQKALLALDKAVNGANERVNHYMRWLLNDMSVMQADPQLNVLATCTVHQPLCSRAQRDMNALIWKESRFESIMPDEWRNTWASEILLGGKVDFDAQLMSIQGHTEKINSVAFRGDGKLISTGSDDHSLKIYEAETGACISTLQGHLDKVNSIAWSHDSRLIASGSDDKSVRVWDAETGTYVILEGHSHKVYTVAFSSDGIIASGSADSTVMIWTNDSKEWSPWQILQGHKLPVQTVSFNPKMPRLVSGSHDKTIVVWCTELWKPLFTISGHSAAIVCVAVSADGVHMASSSDNIKDGVMVWDEHGNLIRTITTYCKVQSIAFNIGDRIAVGSHDGFVKLFDVEGTGSPTTMKASTGRVSSVSFSPDGKRLVSAHAEEKCLKVWDLKKGSTFHRTEGHPEKCCTSLSFTPDGQFIVTCSSDKMIGVWCPKTGKCIHMKLGHEGSIYCLAFSRKTPSIWTHPRFVTGSDDKTIGVWCTATWEKKMTLTGHIGWVRTVAFSENGTKIASGSQDHTVIVWDSLTGNQITTFREHKFQVLAVAFNPSGDRVASAAASPDNTENYVKIWCADSGSLHHVMPGHVKAVCSLVFTPDGLGLISGSEDYRIIFWDATVGELKHVLAGHKGKVTSLAVCRKRLVSSSEDQTVRVWDLEHESIECLHTQPGNSGGVVSVAISPDGRHLAYAAKSVRLLFAI